MLFKYLFLVHVVDWYNISFEKKISVFERCMCVHTQERVHTHIVLAGTRVLPGAFGG